MHTRMEVMVTPTEVTVTPTEVMVTHMGVMVTRTEVMATHMEVTVHKMALLTTQIWKVSCGVKEDKSCMKLCSKPCEMQNAQSLVSFANAISCCQA